MKRLLLSTVAICLTALMFATDFTGGQKFYLQPNANWTSANARFAIYAFGNNDISTWYDMVLLKDGIYEVSIPAEDKNVYTTIIFCRMNPNTQENNWDNKWNQTTDIVYDGIKNLCVIDHDGWDRASSMHLPVQVSAPNKVFINDEIAVGVASIAEASAPTYTITVKEPGASAFAPTEKIVANKMGDYEIEVSVDVNGNSEVFKLYSRAVAAIEGGSKFFLNLGNVWESTPDIRFAAYFFDLAGNSAWVGCALNDTTYSVIAPEGRWSNMIFCSMKAEAPENDWANKVEQTIDLEYNGNDDTFTITQKDGEKYVGTWSKSAPESETPTANNTVNARSLKVYTENATIVANMPIEIYTITGVKVTAANGTLPTGAYIVRSENDICKVMIR